MNNIISEIDFHALENILSSTSDDQIAGFLNQSINDFYAQFWSV